MTKSKVVESEPAEGEDEVIEREANLEDQEVPATAGTPEDDAVQQVVSEIKPLLERTDKEHALARYTLGTKVNELDKSYGTNAVGKLARKLGPGYSRDSLGVFARLARTWNQDEFAALASQGLKIEHFRELAKVQDTETRARIENKAVEKSLSKEKLKKAIRKATGNEHNADPAGDTPRMASGTSTLTVIEALNAIITVTQARQTEQVELRKQLDSVEPQSAQALADQISQALESLRTQRQAIEETERLLTAALQLPTGIAA